jgi:phage host-nuclease inhibitor protein Gam
MGRAIQIIKQYNGQDNPVPLGKLPREASFWNRDIKDLVDATFLRKPKAKTIGDMILWLNKAANAWRNSDNYQQIAKGKKKTDDLVSHVVSK